MYTQNMYYQRYSNYGYPNYAQNFYPTYIPLYQNQYMANNAYTTPITETVIESKETKEETINNPKIETSEETRAESNKNKEFRFGPISLSKETIGIFGFNLAIDDLILIGLILVLFLDSDCDYAFLIILGLMLFNISFSSLNPFS